jgi:hypothetical protein
LRAERQLLLDTQVGGGEVGLGLVGGRQAFADLGGALIERGRDRRPDIVMVNQTRSRKTITE